MVNLKESALQNHLPPKWADILYEHFDGKYSKAHIRNCVYGLKNNIEIVDKAIEIAEDFKLKQTDMKLRLLHLTSN